MKKRKLYWWLFRVNFSISCFTFGGGYVIIPMLRKSYVEKKRLFTEEELLDMAAVAQSSPGAIAVNLSGLCGYRVAGLAGTLICCIAAVLPPLVILGGVSLLYDAFRSSVVIAAILKGMEAGVAAVMADFVIDLCQPIFQKKQLLLSALVPLSFIASFWLQIHVAFILAGSSALIVFAGLAVRRRQEIGTNH